MSLQLWLGFGWAYGPSQARSSRSARSARSFRSSRSSRCPYTTSQAVKTVDIEKAIGKPHSLWCAFAKFYERHGDVPNARVVFEKAAQVCVCGREAA